MKNGIDGYRSNTLREWCALNNFVFDESAFTRKTFSVALGLLCIAVAVIRLLIILRAPTSYTEDSVVFLSSGLGLTIFSESYWALLRPPLVPFVYEILSDSPRAIVLFQSIASNIAWSVFILQSFRSFRLPVVGAALGIGLMIFSLCPPVLQWDATMMSESLFLTLLVFHFSAWLAFVKDVTPRTASIVSLTGFLWVMSRDTAAYVIALEIVALLAVFAFRRRAPYAVLLAALTITFFISVKSADAGERWLFPFYNNLSQRVLVSEEAINFFKHHGMPVTPELLEMRGKWASSDSYAYYKKPELESFRVWTKQYGKSTYMRWILRDPNYFFTAPLPNYDYLSRFGIQFHTMPYPNYSSWWIYSYSLKMLLWLGIAGTALALVRKQVWAAIPFVLALSAFPIALLVWHGDAMDIPRHALSVGISFRLGCWLLGFIAVQEVLLAAKEYSLERRVRVNLNEANWNSGTIENGGNLGHAGHCACDG